MVLEGAAAWCNHQERARKMADIEKFYSAQAEELRAELKAAKASKADYKAKYEAARQHNAMLQQQLEATLAAAVASRATHGAPGGAGPSGWMMHASALGAFLLLRWITYSGHASGAGVLEDKTLMVLAWPAFWVYVLCALNWLPSSALSRSAITYACWLILGYAAHELLEAQGGGYCRATAPGVAYSGGPKLTAHGHLHPGHGAAQAAPPPPTSRSEGVPYY